MLLLIRPCDCLSCIIKIITHVIILDIVYPRSGRQSQLRRADTPYWKKTVLWEEYPFTTTTFMGGTLWMFFLTMILLYAPRG